MSRCVVMKYSGVFDVFFLGVTVCNFVVIPFYMRGYSFSQSVFVFIRSFIRVDCSIPLCFTLPSIAFCVFVRPLLQARSNIRRVCRVNPFGILPNPSVPISLSYMSSKAE